jgi:hypothetical protein
MSTAEKTCTKCKQSKPLGLFGLSKNHKGGVNPWCKACVVESANRWKAANKDRVLEKARANHHRNRDRRIVQQREWRQRNSEKLKEYRQQNSAYLHALVRKRQAAKLQRTPKWADHAKIEAIYAEAAALKALGLDVEIDHIIPLLGRSVCGLHVHDNLRIVLASENRAKGNILLDSVAPIALLELA